LAAVGIVLPDLAFTSTIGSTFAEDAVGAEVAGAAAATGTAATGTVACVFTVRVVVRVTTGADLATATCVARWADLVDVEVAVSAGAGVVVSVGVGAVSTVGAGALATGGASVVAGGAS
jgi:hypothetical protein